MIFPPSCVASEKPTAPQTPVPGSLQPRRIGDQTDAPSANTYRFKRDSHVANTPRHGPDMIERFARGSTPHTSASDPLFHCRCATGWCPPWQCSVGHILEGEEAKGLRRKMLAILHEFPSRNR